MKKAPSISSLAELLLSPLRDKTFNWGKLRGKTYSVKMQMQLFCTKSIQIAQKKKEPQLFSHGSLAAGEGFEPSHTESESAVLPLHNPAIWCCSLRCVVQRTYVIIAGTFDLSTGKFPKNRVLEIFPALRHIQMSNRRSTGSSTRRRRLLCCHSSAVTRRL